MAKSMNAQGLTQLSIIGELSHHTADYVDLTGQHGYAASPEGQGSITCHAPVSRANVRRSYLLDSRATRIH
jgi:hypothetical protein